MIMRVFSLAFFLLTYTVVGFCAESDDHPDHRHHLMAVDNSTVVMNENLGDLPRNCKSISRDYSFTVNAGHQYAEGRPGMIYGMSQHELRVEPCSRIKVTFVNQDEIRHQWMVHGLPRYLYPGGMFHIETAGGQSKAGTFIVPGDEHTYLVHCDMAQHMEKGMRGQLVVGKGGGDLWGVEGVSDVFYRASYLPENIRMLAGLAIFIGFLVTAIIIKTSSPGNTPTTD
jgi:plastocyanin